MVLTVLLLIFLFLFFLFCFNWIPHPAIVFHCKFITGEVYWNFTSYFRYYIVSQFHPNCIPKALYWQCSSKIQTWLHYPIIKKDTWHKTCINLWHSKIPVKVTIWPEIGRPFTLEVNLWVSLLVVIIYFLYVLKM